MPWRSVNNQASSNTHVVPQIHADDQKLLRVQVVPQRPSALSREASCEPGREAQCEVSKTFDAVGSALRSVQAVLQADPGDRQSQSGREKPCKAAMEDIENQEPTWDRVKSGSRPSCGQVCSPGHSPSKQTTSPECWTRRPGPGRMLRGEPLRVRGSQPTPRDRMGSGSYAPRTDATSGTTTPCTAGHCAESDAEKDPISERSKCSSIPGSLVCSPGRSPELQARSPDGRARSPAPGQMVRSERARGSWPSPRRAGSYLPTSESTATATSPAPEAAYSEVTAAVPGHEKARRSSVRSVASASTSAAQAGSGTERSDRQLRCSGQGASGARSANTSPAPSRNRGPAGTPPAASPTPAASAPVIASGSSTGRARSPCTSPGRTTRGRGLQSRGHQAAALRASSLAQARLVHKEKICAGDRSTRFSNHVHAQLDEVLQGLRLR